MLTFRLGLPFGSQPLNPKYPTLKDLLNNKDVSEPLCAEIRVTLHMMQEMALYATLNQLVFLHGFFFFPSLVATSLSSVPTLASSEASPAICLGQILIQIPKAFKSHSQRHQQQAQRSSKCRPHSALN